MYDRIPVRAKGQTEVGLLNGKKFVVDKGEGKGDFKGQVKENGV